MTHVGVIKKKKKEDNMEILHEFYGKAQLSFWS